MKKIQTIQNTVREADEREGRRLQPAHVAERATVWTRVCARIWFTFRAPTGLERRKWQHTEKRTVAAHICFSCAGRSRSRLQRSAALCVASVDTLAAIGSMGERRRRQAAGRLSYSARVAT